MIRKTLWYVCLTAPPIAFSAILSVDKTHKSKWLFTTTSPVEWLICYIPHFVIECEFQIDFSQAFDSHWPPRHDKSNFLVESPQSSASVKCVCSGRAQSGSPTRMVPQVGRNSVSQSIDTQETEKWHDLTLSNWLNRKYQKHKNINTEQWKPKI